MFRAGNNRRPAPAFVVHGEAAGKKGVGRIHLQVVDLDAAGDSFDGEDALRGQTLSVPGEYAVARTQDFDRLERPPADEEGCSGVTRRIPLSVVRITWRSTSILRIFWTVVETGRPSEVKASTSSPGSDGAYRDFRAVRFQDRAFGQKASLIVHDDTIREKGAVRIDKQVVGRRVRGDRANRLHAFLPEIVSARYV